MLSITLSVILVDTLSLSNLLNDHSFDSPIDRKVLSNTEEQGQRHYGLRKTKEWIKLARRNLQI